MRLRARSGESDSKSGWIDRFFIGGMAAWFRPSTQLSRPQPFDGYGPMALLFFKTIGGAKLMTQPTLAVSDMALIAVHAIGS
jgi:hypothetical protein